MDLSDFPQGPFHSRGEFHAAVQLALQLAGHDLFIFDRTLEDWPIEQPAVAALLESFLIRAPNVPAEPRLRIAVRDSHWIDRQPARLSMLRRRFAHAIECRRAPAYAGVDEGVLIVDHQHLLKRYHSDYYRGRLTLNCIGEVEALKPRYRTLWDEAGPCAPARPLGL